MHTSIRLLMIIGLFPGLVEAATFVVTRTDDPPPTACLPTHCTLREAVIDAHGTAEADTIILGDAVYLIDLLDSNDGSEAEGDLDVRSDMTIQGVPGTIIDGQMQGRIIDVRDANLTLDSVTLRNANTSLDTNGTLNGGAINADDATLSLVNTQILDSSAQGLGGGIYARDGSIITIRNSHFEGIVGSSGGALHTRGCDVTIVDSSFVDNHADSTNAGAFYFQGAGTVATISGSLFQDNSSAAPGGAIYHGGGAMSIADSTFERNRSPTRQGGAISVSSSTPARTLDVLRGTFTANEAQSGGALSLGNNQVSRFQASLFEGNSAYTDGGALYATGGDSEFINTTFSGNDAVSDGGAMHLFSSLVHLTHVTISGNTAPDGSALWTGSTTGVTVIANSIVDGECNISGSSQVDSMAGNLEGPGDTCGLDQSEDDVNQSENQLGLEPLAENGGATQTHALTPSSSARNHGVPETCYTAAHDQRFGARDSQCDAGAYEFEGVANDYIFGDNWQ